MVKKKIHIKINNKMMMMKKYKMTFNKITNNKIMSQMKKSKIRTKEIIKMKIMMMKLDLINNQEEIRLYLIKNLKMMMTMKVV